MRKDIAKYPRELSRVVLRGLTAQLRADKRLIAGCYGLQAADEGSSVEEHVYGPAQGYPRTYKDDLAGQTLRGDMAKSARAKELGRCPIHRLFAQQQSHPDEHR